LPEAQEISTEQWLLLLIVAAGVCASMAAWAVFVTRPSILRYRPRRHVPWGGIHLGAVVLMYLALALLMNLLIVVYFPGELMEAPSVPSGSELDSMHPIVRLFVQGSPGVLVACGLMAVVVAPIVEEFFFRVLLQGWLEARQRRWCRRIPALRRLMPGAAWPIVLVSLVFAAMHFRGEGPAPSILLLAVDSVAKIITIGLAVVLFRFHPKATAADLGWEPKQFFRDVGLGLLSFAALGAPLYAMMLFIRLQLPESVTPDPFVLFPFSLALGYLYYRTHSIVPSIVLHMALNATSLAMLLLAIGQQ
jgi:membrane protease YdiL (CAAX protease family)